MQRKYYPIDVSSFFNHKMMYASENLTQGFDPNIGVMGIVVNDKKYNFIDKMMYLNGIRFKLYGNQAEQDNFICNGQVITVPPRNKYKKLAIMGFNEFFSYKTVFQVVSNNTIYDHTVMFYHFNENIEALYDNEKTESSCEILRSKSNTWQKVKCFCDIVEIEADIDKIICPVNIETHIVAITAIA